MWKAVYQYLCVQDAKEHEMFSNTVEWPQGDETACYCEHRFLIKCRAAIQDSPESTQKGWCSPTWKLRSHGMPCNANLTPVVSPFSGLPKG